MVKSVSLYATLATGIFAGLTATWPAPAAADAVADFYRGKTITSIQVFGSGGLYGLYNRLFARYMAKYIPGHPTMIIQEMKGGGGLKGANYLYNAAPQNGTYLGLLNKDLAVFQVMRPKAAKYDVAKFDWVGRAVTFATVTYVTAKSPAKTIDEAKRKQVILAATGKAAASYMLPTLLNSLIGTKFKVVTGYGGGSAMTLSADRGETYGWAGGGAIGYLAPPKSDDLKSGKILLLFQTGKKPYAQFGDVPLMRNLTKDRDARRLMDLIDSGTDIGMALTSTPNTPRDRLQALRTAFTKAMQDPGMKAEIAKRGLLLEPATGEELQAIARESIDVPAALVKRGRRILGVK